MIKNYFKTAFRSLIRNKGFTAINVLGLTLGIATCLLIVFYVFDELSYDRYNAKAERIYRVNNDIKFGGNENSYAVAPAPAAMALKADFPEIEQAARIISVGGVRVRKGGQLVQEDRVLYADSTLFSVFTFPMIEGNPTDALKAPNSIVINERTARKYFDRTDVVGQSLTLDDGGVFRITGVIKDIPIQSHFNADIFFPMSVRADSREDAWLSNNFFTYILLKPGADPVALQAKFAAFLQRHAGQQVQNLLHMDFAALEKSGNYFRFSLVPLTDIHLRSRAVGELLPGGSIAYVYIFSAIAAFILILACINFMNLSTARSANRAREVGVRKVLGSPRKYLIAQFLTESVMVTLAGAILAVVMAWALLPLFNEISGKELVVSSRLVRWMVPILLVFVLIIGCLAGSYPAFFLSAFQPIDVLKDNRGNRRLRTRDSMVKQLFRSSLARGFKGGGLRSFLVVFQFAISIFLITGTLVVYNQLKYIQSRDLGFNRDHVLIVQNVYGLGNQAKSFKQEVKKIRDVDDVTMTGALPTANYLQGSSFFKDRSLSQESAVLSQRWYVDEGYIPTLGIKLKSGRNFSAAMPTDSSAILINEAEEQMLGYSDPLNHTLYAALDNTLQHIGAFHIVGVVKNFNFRSLRQQVTPMVLHFAEDRSALSIRIHAGANIPAVMAQISNKWKELSSSQQFTYSFMEQDFEALYRSEQRMGKLFISFTCFAILIACLGLFGLAAYAAEQRTKEIGIRKVLGAGVSTIVGMLSKDFIKLVLIAILIASPLAWLAMGKWLQGFAYRQDMQWWVFALAGFSAVLIAFITISFQSIKAALSNPVKSLKSE
jgi:putative ABC transport system permease protein